MENRPRNIYEPFYQHAQKLKIIQQIARINKLNLFNFALLILMLKKIYIQIIYRLLMDLRIIYHEFILALKIFLYDICYIIQMSFLERIVYNGHNLQTYHLVLFPLLDRSLLEIE